MAAKRSPLIVAYALGIARYVGLELQVRPVDLANLGGVGEAEKALDLEGVGGGRAQPLRDLAAQRARHLLFDLEPDHLTAPPLAQRRLVFDHEVRGLVVDFDFAVADDAEGAGAGDLVAGKHLVQEQVDQRVDGHDLDPPLGRQPRRQGDEAVEIGRARARAPSASAVAARPAQLEGQREARDWG